MTIKTNTVLVSMELDGKLYFAADRRMSWDFGKAATCPDSKIAKRKGVLLTGTGDSSLCAEIVNRTQFPEYKGQKPDDFIYDDFLPFVIAELRSKGIVDKEDRRLMHRLKSTDEPYASILVGIKAKEETGVYEVTFTGENIVVNRVPTNYTSGCGGKYAMAILSFLVQSNFDRMKVTKETRKKKIKLFTPMKNYEILRLKPREILEQAIFMAANHSPGCDDNVSIEVLE